MNYKVTWEIEVGAESAYKAALEARYVQRDTDSLATFLVQAENEKLISIITIHPDGTYEEQQ